MHRSRSRLGFTLIELLVVIAIVATLIGLLVSAVQRARAAADRTTCQSKLKDLGMAILNYEGANKRLPSGVESGGMGYVSGPSDYPIGASFPHNFWSWMAQILPHIDQNALYTRADTWAKKGNLSDLQWWPSGGFWLVPPTLPNPAFETVVPAFTCPVDTQSHQPNSEVFKPNAVAFTSYLGVTGDNDPVLDWTDSLRIPAPACNGVLYFRSKVKILEITDGTSCTLMVGERPPSKKLDYGWWFAGVGYDGSGTGDVVLGAKSVQYANSVDCGSGFVGLQPPIDKVSDQVHFWSYHDGGAYFLFCDGHVTFLSYSTDNKTLSAMATRASAEVVPPLD